MSREDVFAFTRFAPKLESGCLIDDASVVESLVLAVRNVVLSAVHKRPLLALSGFILRLR